MKPALLVIDMQNAFFAESSPARGSLCAAAEYLNAAIQLFRKAAAPIVIISDIEPPDRVPGQDPFELHPSIEATADDPRIHKRFGNAFWQTGLDEALRARSVDMLILGGYCAEHCVLDTFRGARERGYAAAMLRGALASPRPEHIRLVEAITEIISYGALAGFLGLPG